MHQLRIDLPLFLLRHTSGNKGSMSRLSYDDPVPPSPLKKEFTSEPPTDVPRVTTATADLVSSNQKVASSDTLSVNTLPQLLEKLSDAGSCQESDLTNSASVLLPSPHSPTLMAL